MQILLFHDDKKVIVTLTHAQYEARPTHFWPFSWLIAARFANDQGDPYNGGTDEIWWSRGAHHRSRGR